MHFARKSRGQRPPTLAPIAVSLAEAENITRLHRSTLRRANARGELPFVKVGSRTLVRVSDLRRLLGADAEPHQ